MLVRRLLLPLCWPSRCSRWPRRPVPGPRTDAAFVRATNADAAMRAAAMAALRTLAKLVRSHSVAMARKSVQRYGGRCDARALWHNDISKSTGHRSNILYRRANLFGVGTCIRNGVIWVTVNFEKTTPG